MKNLSRVLILAFAGWSVSAPVRAQPASEAAAGVPKQGGPQSLATATLEDLMSLQVTSASRKEQRAADVAAAVTVITQDDIRRSGMTTLPELLRLVPGVQVARINSGKWAVSARGFGTLFSNKLLVLIDGRSIYDRLNSGEFWESEDLILEDIDRIEVIRGPGGAVWGANAVNGVINILTKSAGQTQGTSVRAAGGSLDSSQASIRYGGKIRGAAYRVFTQWSDHGESRLETRAPASDDWQSAASGFRLDWAGMRDAVMLEGNASAQHLHSLFRLSASAVPGALSSIGEPSDTQIANVLGRWTRTAAGGTSLRVQSFLDARPRNDPGVHPRQITADVDVAYHTVLGRHDIVSGTGYRFTRESVAGGFGYSLFPDRATDSVANLFAQDEIALARERVHLTIGSKLEHDTHAGWGFQPAVRGMWRVADRQRVWAAVSRALRTPSLNDLGARINYAVFAGAGGLPTVLASRGNPDFKSEQLVGTDAGYRLDIGTRAAVDVSIFRGRYTSLQTNEPEPPFMEFTPAPAHLVIATQYGNLLRAVTTGAELAGHWQPLAGWRMDGSFTAFHLTPHLDAASGDVEAAATDGNAPRRQWQLHSTVAVGPRTDVSAALFYVGSIRSLGVPAYTRADLNVELRIAKRWSAAITGQNLLDPSHAEFGAGIPVLSTLVPRSLRVQLIVRP